jgi:hypothetical protein
LIALPKSSCKQDRHVHTIRVNGCFLTNGHWRTSSGADDSLCSASQSSIMGHWSLCVTSSNQMCDINHFGDWGNAMIGEALDSEHF